MSTWHQDHSNYRLYHDTEWTVVEDPPNDCRALALFDTELEANAWRDQCKRLHPSWSVYVLKPASVTKRTK